jgi:hypothetical protein
MTDTINQDHDDGVDRRGFLHCMAWAGTFVRRSHALAIVDQTLA